MGVGEIGDDNEWKEKGFLTESCCFNVNKRNELNDHAWMVLETQRDRLW